MPSVQLIVVIVIVSCIAIGTWRYLRRLGDVEPKLDRPDEGRIVFDRGLAALFVLMVPGMIAAGIFLIGDGRPVLGWALIVLALPNSLTDLRALRGEFDVTWDTHGVTGPSRRYGPALGPLPRCTIAWTDLAGGTATRLASPALVFMFVRARDGRRVHISEMLRGYRSFLDVLADRRTGG